MAKDVQDLKRYINCLNMLNNVYFTIGAESDLEKTVRKLTIRSTLFELVDFLEEYKEELEIGEFYK